MVSKERRKPTSLWTSNKAAFILATIFMVSLWSPTIQQCGDAEAEPRILYTGGDPNYENGFNDGDYDAAGNLLSCGFSLFTSSNEYKALMALWDNNVELRWSALYSIGISLNFRFTQCSMQYTGNIIVGSGQTNA